MITITIASGRTANLVGKPFDLHIALHGFNSRARAQHGDMLGAVTCQLPIIIIIISPGPVPGSPLFLVEVGS